jgi:primary-amine oxidase
MLCSSQAGSVQSRIITIVVAILEETVRRDFAYVWVLLVSILLSPALLAAQAAAPQHPLEGLTSGEYWAVHEVLQASGKMTPDTLVMSLLLHEPAKEKVLAWKPGDPFTREADAVLMRKGTVNEVRVNLGEKKVESWKEVKGVQAPIFVSELFQLGELAKNDPRMQTGFAKRGIKDMTTVDCVALPFGYFAMPEMEGHRILYGGCSDKTGAFLTWGREIPGLYFELDAVEKKILKVIDEEVVAVPQSPINFEEAPAAARLGTTPISIVQPVGPGFQFKNGEVSWQNWHFRVRLDARVGPVVNLVRLDDDGKQRSVMYEGSMSELYVPYMDPAYSWATRVFIDAGEFFPGGVLRPMREGVDCPSNAEYMDGLSPNEQGIPAVQPKLACLFESVSGSPAWRHFEQNQVWSRPTRTLILRAAAVIGNYDYLLDWRFEQDGSIRVAVGATGIIETKGAKDKMPTADDAMAGGTGETKDEYGHFVGENTVGVNHDHFFSFRIDLDVDGQNNTFMADRLEKRELPASTHRKSIWVVKPTVAHTERDAMIDIHLERPSMWTFVNPNVHGPLGYPTGYEIMPGTTAASLLDPDDGVQKVGAFSNHQLWVTPYRPDELYAAGVYPIESKGDDGLAVWTKANRPIENTDIVAWYTMGFHHLPRAEDWPVMPVMWHDFVIRPFDFFPRNPVMTLPTVP